MPRVLDHHLRDMVSALPAIAIDGCKGVGKTETASRLAAARIELDRETEIQALREDPDYLTRFEHPLLIDEWQLYPAVWDKVRRAVDRQIRPGQFILTGSATPSQAPKHSGAGRIVHLRMRPFSLAERGLVDPLVSLAELVAGAKPDLSGRSTAGIDDYADQIITGGLPALRAVPDRFRRAAWDGYLAELLECDLPELGRPVRRRDTLRAWLRAYASATASTASYTTILDAATPADADKPIKATTLAWRESLARMWLLDPLPAWDDPLHRLSRLAGVPKHHLADPALAAHLLGLSPQTLLTKPGAGGRALPRPGTIFGALFESLAAQSVRVYAETLDATVSHLRTRDGDHEIDLILTRPDGRCLALEVKAAPAIDAADVKHLHWLQARLGDDLIDSLVLTTGAAAYRRHEDGIGVLPLALLGP